MTKRFVLICPYCKEEALEFIQRPYKGMLMCKKTIKDAGEGIIKCKSCDKILLNKDLKAKNVEER